MNTEKLVSIIIPVYNAAPYLKEAVHSVIKQTYTDWELILVDDASTDNSFAVMQQLQTEFGVSEKIRLFAMKENKGPAAARNKGRYQAKGRYLAYLDADDLWDAKKLELQLEFTRKHQHAFTFTGYEFGNADAKGTGKMVHVPKQLTYREALTNTTISIITVMLDRSQIPDRLLNMPEECQREDTALWWKLLKNGYTAYGFNQILSVYRRTKESYSANKLKAVAGTWQLYRKQEGFSAVRSACYLGMNLCRAVKRRI